jgi:hypothetical protein
MPSTIERPWKEIEAAATATAASERSRSVSKSGAFNTGEAPARVLNVLAFEFDAQVVPTRQSGRD